MTFPTRVFRPSFFLLAIAFCGTACVAADDAEEKKFPEPVNTQEAGQHPPKPEEMVGLIDVPDGFNVTLFAAEPDVRQPIAIDFDDRGRLWVAENYSYGAHGKYDTKQRDRIIILHDADGDGVHDSRKVFWDQGWMLTGMAWGHGGLWVLNNATLSLIPDTNGDDIPDGEPIEMLNGWTKNAGHNFVNGLMWGPDGWLYGRHGITDSSLPGTPETPPSKRRAMNCGIWRFHPVRREFEVVCDGTTNPWGLDYNEHGQFFMTNNVIGHLWHVIPGAHYERMFGQDFNPYVFELMQQTADHYHWDESGTWTASRDGKADSLGGGHSHCGGMIYQGGNWPDKYRGQIFMCNTHGRRVNCNRLDPSFGTYIGKREPDFLTVDTPWFRGVEMKYGPDGSVFLTDWSDFGECHDHDGVHRTSGRIFRIAWGTPKPVDLKPESLTLPQLTDLATLGSSDNNEWHRRHARRMWTERIVRQFPQTTNRADSLEELSVGKILQQRLQNENEIVALNTAWLLGAVNGLSAADCESLLKAPSPHVRAFVVRHISESPELAKQLADSLIAMLHAETSPVVAMASASAVQRLPHASRRDLGPRILQELTEDAPVAKFLVKDRQLLLMTWYGLVHTGMKRGKPGRISNPDLRQFELRYQATNWERNSEQLAVRLSNSLKAFNKSAAQEYAGEWLTAVLAGVGGRSRVTTLPNWNDLQQQLRSLGDTDIKQQTAELSALFGDGRGAADLRALVKNRNGDHPARERAIMALAQSGDKEALPILLNLLTDRAVYNTVLKALARYEDDRIPKEILRRWTNFRHQTRGTAVDTLASRASFAEKLIAALDSGKVPAADLSAAQVRQLLSFQNEKFTSVLESKWGLLRKTPAERAALIDSWKAKLDADTLAKADLTNGAALFKKSCSNCHRLYGNGGKIGPDLTGSNRDNLDYLLGNIIAPSDIVPKQYTSSVIVTDRGRVITGVVLSENGGRLLIQTDKEQITVDLSDVDQRTATGKSLMPNGLLDPLADADVRDLIAFLMRRR